MENRPIFNVIEFCGDGDAFFGGNAADWGLRRLEDGTDEFMSAADGCLRKVPRAYFPNKEEAEVAAAAASKRGGLISVLEKTVDPRIPTGQIEWLVQRLHVGTPDDEIVKEISDRLSGPCDGDLDILAQASAFALACHRANQELVREFRL
jgi:hypothetical protein